MKKTLTTFMLAAIALGAQALQVIDLTTRVTNTATSTGSVITIPGLVTNAAFTTVKSNNVIIGDTLSAAFAKVNFNFSNLPAGGGNATNAVPIFNGGATNLTVTNAFKLTSTTPYYSIASYTITNMPTGSSVGATSDLNGTYYPASALGSGVLTNSNGFILNLSSITSISNNSITSITVSNGSGNGPYYPATALGANMLTNSIGLILSLSSVTTISNNWITSITVSNGNGSGPYYPAPALGTNILTNSIGLILSLSTITSYSTNLVTGITVSNGTGSVTYYPSTASGSEVLTNSDGLILTLPLIQSSSSNLVTGITVSNSNGNGTYYPAPALGAGVLTNSEGFILTLSSIQSTSNNWITGITVSNGSGTGPYSIVGNSGLLFTNSITIVNTDGNTNALTVLNAGETAANKNYTPCCGGLTTVWYQSVAGGTYYYEMVNYSSALWSNTFVVSNWNFYKFNSTNFSENTLLYIKTNNGTRGSITGAWIAVNGTLPAPKTVYGTVSSVSNFWADYSTNTWNFYSATNAAFTSNSVTVIGTYSKMFFITNISYIPSNGIPYLTSAGNYATFSTTNALGVLPVIGGVNFTNIPTSLAPTISNPSTNSIAPPSFSSGCNVYVIFKVGSVVKYLLDGTVRWDSAHKVNQDTGLKTSYLSIDASGNATLVIAGTLAETVPWTSSSWRTTIPSDACSTTPFTTPTKMY